MSKVTRAITHLHACRFLCTSKLFYVTRADFFHVHEDGSRSRWSPARVKHWLLRVGGRKPRRNLALYASTGVFFNMWHNFLRELIGAFMPCDFNLERYLLPTRLAVLHMNWTTVVILQTQGLILSYRANRKSSIIVLAPEAIMKEYFEGRVFYFSLMNKTQTLAK